MNARQVAAFVVMVALVPVSALAQELTAQARTEEPGMRPSYKDVYCAGFISSKRVNSSLYLLAGEDAVGRLTYSEGEYVYLNRGSKAGLQVGAEYLVVRWAKDPTKIESFSGQNGIIGNVGTLYQDVGRVRIHVVHETTATAQIVYACDSLQNGDILVPFQERPVTDYREMVAFDRFAPFSGGVEGTILAARDFPALLGRGDAIYINLGTKHDVKVGDYFRIFRYATGPIYEGAKRGHMSEQPGYNEQGINYWPSRRGDLPREPLGEAMVVWVDKESTTALITHGVREIHPGDFVELQPPLPPTASLAAEPRTVVRGESAVLSWATTQTSQREISPGVGAVGRTGTTRVTPAQTTTYRITATGPGGSTEASVTLTVTEPPPPPPPPPPTPEPEPEVAPPTGPTMDELFAQNVQDVFFDYKSSNIREEARTALEHTAAFLRAYADINVLIEGHCDEIGGVQYNRRLGEQRAEAVRDVLAALGVDPSRLSLLSYGKERPFCTESSEEACRQLNRRAHLLRQ